MGESIVLICPTTQCRGRATDWHDGQCRILGQMRLLIVGAPRAFQSSLSKIKSDGFLHAGPDDPNQIEPAHELILRAGDLGGVDGSVMPDLPSDLSRRASPRRIASTDAMRFSLTETV
jgi:hypothetical protein